MRFKIQNSRLRSALRRIRRGERVAGATNFKFVRMPFRILSSKPFLIWMIGGWILYYVTSAIWLRESFANFVSGLQTSKLIQAPFLIFLVSGFLNLIRASGEIYKKGQVQFIAWIILPFGTLIFLAGFFTSLKARQLDWIAVAEGHSVKPRWGADDYSVRRIDAGLEDRFLDTDVISGKGLFKYEPKVIIADKSLRTSDVGAFPPKKIGNTYFHIMNFGLAPGIRFLEGGKVKNEGYLPLKILLPGSSDYVDIPPYRLIMSIEPEKIIQKGGLKAQEFNLKAPLYKMKVFRGEKIIAEGDSRGDMNFDNVTISYIGSTFWVQLEIVRDPALPLVLAGLLLITAGIPLSLFRQVLVFSGKI